MNGLAILAGLGVGLVFGATALRTNFCVMGSVTDILLLGDWRRFRAWLLAIAVALAGTQALAAVGAVSLDASPYLAPRLGWLGAIGGGGVFGFGMVLAGGCGQRSLVRVGAGSLKSLVVVLMLGLFAGITAHGLGGPAWLEGATGIDLGGAGGGTQETAALLAGAAGIEPALARGAVAVALVGGLAWICFKDAMFRRSGRNIAAGLILGALVPLGWWLTSLLAVPGSLGFVGPVADGLGYLVQPGTEIPAFATAAVVGVVAGAFLAVAIGGRFRIEVFDGGRDVAHHLIGGAMMGVGGAFALGGTIGQGMTGVSTLALGSLLVWAAIVGGAVAGLKYLERADRPAG